MFIFQQLANVSWSYLVRTGVISKCAIIPPKKQVVKIKKIEADTDSDGDGNHTCSRLQKNQ